MTQTPTKTPFIISKEKKLDINKLVLIFSVFLQLCTQVHRLRKYTGSVQLFKY